MKEIRLLNQALYELGDCNGVRLVLQKRPMTTVLDCQKLKHSAIPFVSPAFEVNNLDDKLTFLRMFGASCECRFTPSLVRSSWSLAGLRNTEDRAAYIGQYRRGLFSYHTNIQISKVIFREKVTTSKILL